MIRGILNACCGIFNETTAKSIETGYRYLRKENVMKTGKRRNQVSVRLPEHAGGVRFAPMRAGVAGRDQQCLFRCRSRPPLPLPPCPGSGQARPAGSRPAGLSGLPDRRRLRIRHLAGVLQPFERESRLSLDHPPGSHVQSRRAGLRRTRHTVRRPGRQFLPHQPGGLRQGSKLQGHRGPDDVVVRANEIPHGTVR